MGQVHGKRKYNARRKIYVLYQNDWPVAVGTIRELEQKTGISEKTLQFYASKACRKRGTSKRYLIDSGEYDD